VISRVALDGADLPLDTVFAAVTIRHGRASVDDAPIGSTCSLSLVDVERELVRDLRVGSELELDVATAGAAWNEIRNGHGEIDLLWLGDWGHANVTQTRDTARRRHGSASIRVTTPGLAANEGTVWFGEVLPAGASQWVASAWVKGKAGTTMRLQVYNAAVTSQRASADHVLTGEWQRLVSAPFLKLAAAEAYWVFLQPQPSLGTPHAFNVGGVQLEAGAIATPYIPTAGARAQRLASVPRFRGRVTDAALEPADATLSLLAVSTLARISGREVGAVEWPSETWTARVARIFAEVGATAELVLEAPSSDPLLVARPADPLAFAAALGELAESVPAAIADRPDGRVLVQAIASRQGLAELELDPDAVLYAPEWVQADDVRNVVKVAWSGGEYAVEEPASIAALEERAPLSLSTWLELEPDAISRAILELTRRSWPEWAIEAAELLELELELGVGRAIALEPLPASAPAERVVALLEGWEDHVEPGSDGELEWAMRLSLSHPRLSGYGGAWQDVAPAETWATVDAAVTWAETEDLTYA
jgi:hypothetical protein